MKPDHFTHRLLLAALAMLLGLSVAAVLRAAPPVEEKLEKPIVEPIAGAEAVPFYKDRDLKRLVRETFTREEDLNKYGLWLDADWKNKDAAKDVVVLIHGLDSSPENAHALLDSARAAGYPTGCFCYQNDQGLDESAKFLSKHLKLFTKDHPGRGVSIVSHSMGGLIARAVIEDSELDPGNVHRLIMVAPPSQGSNFAELGVGLDLIEHIVKLKDGNPLKELRASVVDGLDEAVDDLAPTSKFLKDLNARKRNPKVQYTIILGTKGILSANELGLIRDGVKLYLDKASFLAGPVKKLDALLADLDEVLPGQGDGVVAIKRGQLDGVTDVVKLEFDHLRVAEAAGDDKQVQAVQKVICDRLNKKVGG